MSTNFVDMKYERADIEAIRSGYDALTDKVRNADNAEAVFEAVAAHTQLSSQYETMASLAYIRHTIDTRDEFYTSENDFYDENSPLVEEKTQDFLVALFESAYRPQLEERYGKLMFDDISLRLKCFSPEVIPELQEENRLVSEYGKLTASAQIEFDGKTLNLSQLGAYRISPDREVRKAATYANGRFFADKERFDRIDHMVLDLIFINFKPLEKHYCDHQQE